MKKRDDLGRLQDILDAISRIEIYMDRIDATEFARDIMRQDAVILQLQVIGEASRNVSFDFQEHHSEIAWSEIIGMRNKLAHDYGEIEIAVVWDTAKNDIPQLKSVITNLLDRSKG